MRSIFFDTSIPRVLSTMALSKVWRGATTGPTAPVSKTDIPPGPLPGPRWVRLANKQCGICASDLHLVFCDIDPMVHAAAIPAGDRIFLGHEVVSEVVEVGSGVQTLAVGDRVAMLSRFLGKNCRVHEHDELCRFCARGDYCLCERRIHDATPDGVGGGWSDEYTAHETEVWKVPEELDDDAATLVEPIACGVRAVLRRPPAPGDKVLVVGCGTIGLGVLWALRALAPESKRFALARYEQQRAMAEEAGATVVGDLGVLDAAAKFASANIYTGEFKNRSSLGGFDVIYDCVASAATTGESLRAARAGGAVVMAGVNLNRMKIDLTPVLLQEVDLLGSLAHGAEDWQGERLSTFSLTGRFLADGTLPYDGFITHRFSLDDWKAAIATATDKSSGCIKVVFDTTA